MNRIAIFFVLLSLPAQSIAQPKSEAGETIYNFIDRVAEGSRTSVGHETVTRAIIAGFRTNLPVGSPQAICLENVSLNSIRLRQTSAAIAACLTDVNTSSTTANLLDDAISDALFTLDPGGHLSRRLPSQGDRLDRYYRHFHASKRGSLGVSIKRMDDKTFEVFALIAGGSAEKAGLKVGDRLIGVDGKDADPDNFEGLMSALRGPIGSEARLLVVRRDNEKTEEVTILRAPVSQDGLVGAVRSIPTQPEMLVVGDTLGIRIPIFLSGITEPQIHQFLKRHLSGKTKLPIARIIIDLRGSVGGEVGEINRVADLFLDKGRIFSIAGPGESKDHRDARSGTVVGTIPVHCLVDDGIASGAAILATALRHHQRGKIFGSPFTVDGDVHDLLRLDDVRAINLTTGSIMQADGTALQGRIEPDLAVSLDRDESLEATLLELSAKVGL